MAYIGMHNYYVTSFTLSFSNYMFPGYIYRERERGWVEDRGGRQMEGGREITQPNLTEILIRIIYVEFLTEKRPKLSWKRDLNYGKKRPKETQNFS